MLVGTCVALWLSAADPTASAPTQALPPTQSPATTTPTADPLDDLEAIANASIDAARPRLRAAARSAAEGAVRAQALRLLATRDASAPTARICARALRIDAEPLVRRAAAECLGRHDAQTARPQTPALVAALDDESLDVVTMAGWALSNVGDGAALQSVATRAQHPDPRVAALFNGYAQRMIARLGLVGPVDTVARDAQGRVLVPPGAALTTRALSLEKVGSVAWLGLYGASVGWYHGTFLTSAQGGVSGAQLAPLVGIGGSIAGFAAASTYGFLAGADDYARAHTVVQMGTLGTLVGFGAGYLTDVQPSASVGAANLSLVGTLAGTGLGVVMAHTRPPTLGALGLGLVTATTTSVATGALVHSYYNSSQAAIGAALLLGPGAGMVTTLVAAPHEIGAFPLAGGLVGGLTGGGVGALTMWGVEGLDTTEASGWVVASGVGVGVAAGVLGASFLPKQWDPLLHKSLPVQVDAPAVAALSTSTGAIVPALQLSGTF